MILQTITIVVLISFILQTVQQIILDMHTEVEIQLNLMHISQEYMDQMVMQMQLQQELQHGLNLYKHLMVLLVVMVQRLVDLSI